MHSTRETESARQMAQWLATGGAGPETAAEARTGDDGLQASATYPGYGPYCTDDGLQASATYPGYGPYCTDDGLQAMPTQWACRQGLKTPALKAGGAPSNLCGDDGLGGGSGSRGHVCYGDDGLAAANLSAYSSSTCGLADDGLQAAVSRPVVCGDDGLTGGNWTRWWCTAGIEGPPAL